MANKAEREHFANIVDAGCVVCQHPEVEIHHIREFGEKRNNFKVICLCLNHHRGPEGVHHLGKKEWRRRYGHECDYLTGGERGTN